MDLTLLPKVLEDIINQYTYQIEHSQKFKKCLEAIKEIEYYIFYDDYHDVIRTIRNHTHYYYFFYDRFEIEQYYRHSTTITITEGTKYDFEYW